MHWKTKSRIQNAVALLPSSTSYAVYYWIQRHFGGLRKIDPVSRLKAGIDTWNVIKESGSDPRDKVFLEVGTGRVPITPMAYWLMGAKRIFTLDVNPYLKVELIKESTDFILNNKRKIQILFGSLLNNKRLDDLLLYCKDATFSASEFLQHCNIDYVAPGDAAQTGLMPGSIDFHTSFTVFEHISPMKLRAIIREGNRIIGQDGLFVHKIDYSDHFSHSDTTITAINFLQYSDSDWHKYSGNKYMYMNRLRHDDFLELLEELDHRILLSYPEIDQESLDTIRSGSFHLDEKFLSKSEDMLSVRSAWIVSQL